MIYGNGLNRTYTYDSDYRLTGLVTSDPDTSIQNLTYGYDAADNILSIADAITAGRSQTFTYDSLFRLKTAAATGTYGSIAYNYDDVGNRTSVVQGSTETYSTATASNRLLSVTAGGVTRSFSYDGAGNIISDNDGGVVYGLGYNKGNRLRQVNLNGTPVYYYLYNALGERVKKTVGADLRHFHYDRDGRLIAETTTTGAVILEYAWLNGLPIGEFTNASGGTPPASVQVDNGDAGASFTGNWTTATAGSGYIGSNYRQHVPETVPAGGIVIDNSSAQFSTLGTWTTETAPSGFEGSDYRRREPEAVAKTASWEIPGSQIPQTGSYKVYAKWPASSQHATDVPFTVTHAGGTSTVTVNQRVNGGTWNLLGTYTFNSGTTYKVELTDAVAAGKVAADAIYVVSTAAPAAAFTWTPAIPSAGSWRVLARWPAASTNTANAQYTVTHAGGTSIVTLNQKQNGGSWMSLGTWSFTPGAGHKVMLAASSVGTTIADAILFAGPTVQPANLLYVHPDHLGSPQKLTTPSQATAWDGVFDPFGEEAAVTGLAAMPLRFPGQYTDEETGYSYNYFRDYEPRLGRYIESDPVGLRAGMNTYAYVAGNPVLRTDSTGLLMDEDWRPGERCDLNPIECTETGGGGGGGDIIIAALMLWIWANSDDADTEAQKKAERDAYHRRCDEPPPPGLSKCDLIRWKIQRAKDCIRMRQDYMNKWNDTYQGHYDQIAQRQRELDNLEQALKQEKCCEE